MQPDQRAQKVIDDSKDLGVPNVVMSKDILSVFSVIQGNEKLNTLFCAELFNNCPGLEATEEEYNAAKLLDDDVEGSREERSKLLDIRGVGVGLGVRVRVRVGVGL